MDGRRIWSETGLDRRRAGLRRDLPAGTDVEQPDGVTDSAVCGRPGLRLLRAPDLELRIAQYSAEVLGLRHRHLCAESRTVAEYLRVPGRMVCGAPVLAMDFLAERPAGSNHGGVSQLRGSEET